MSEQIKVGDVVRVTVVHAGSLRGLCEVEPIVPNELMHTTPEGLTGADATWAAGVMERDRAQRNAALKRADAAEAKLAEVTKERDALARRVEGTPPWTFSKRPTVEEMDALRTRWSAGPERYQADFDMVMGALAGAIDRAERAEAELAALRPIGSEGSKPRQPDGYDPGARPSPDPSPYPWCVAGAWLAVQAPAWAEGPCKLVSHVEWSTWEAVRVTGLRCRVQADGRYRPATPEETARFEAELAKNTKAAPVAAPSALGGAIAWAGCLAEAEMHPGRRLSRELREEIFDEAHTIALRAKCGDLVDAWDLASTFQDWLDAGAPEAWPKPAPIPLAVGQRWVWEADEAGPPADDEIVSVSGGHVWCLDHGHEIGGDADRAWRCQTIERFRESHPRLRDPSELEPAPDTGWGPKQVAERTTVTSGPLGDPAPEPKTSLPVVPATCGECEHAKPCGCHTRTNSRSPCREILCAHPNLDPTQPGVMRTLPPPRQCPLRKPSDELRSKETP